jgi:uncharacterized protein (TIGR02145 family)
VGNTLFATPSTGSQEAQNVSHPLPISFSVIKDVSSPICVEVLSTENKLPGDFGLVNFPISGINVINFQVITVDKENGMLLSAKLTVLSGLYVYVQKLDSSAQNLVTVKDSLGSYTLMIEKIGYVTYEKYFTGDSLKLFNNIGNHSPLLVELARDTSKYGTVKDIEGNIYKTVKIGNQWWMAENLKVTHYRNGDPIPFVTGNIEWSNRITGACCDYNNDPNISKTYGRLYNWYASKDTRNIAPLGWHVAISADWGKLYTYLGGQSGAVGAKLKETGTTHWQSPNTGATNITGFTALPAGSRYGSSYLGLGSYSNWITDYDGQPGMTGTFSLYNNSSDAYFHHSDYNSGLSVRCVRD